MQSVIADYLLYNEGNECPRNYHIWSFLVLMSAIVGKRTKITISEEGKKSYFDIYFNLYAGLVGPQGNRKSVACDLAYAMLLDVIPDYPVSASVMSREAIAQFLDEEKGKINSRAYKTESGFAVEYKPFAMFINEMDNFSSINPIAMIQFLTDIYDRKFFKVITKGAGTDTIVNPFITMIGCCTPEWVSENLKGKVLKGGFCRRMIWVYETEHQRIAFPTVTPEGELALERVKVFLRKLKDQPLKDEFRWTPDARKWYRTWYHDLKPPNDPIMAGYYESKHIQMLKTAGLYSLCESPICVLEVRHLEMSCASLDALELNMPKLSEGVGRNELAHHTVKTLEVLEMAGGIMPEKELDRKSVV